VSLYVSDTHALLWYLGGASHLSAPARAKFDEAERQGKTLGGVGRSRKQAIAGRDQLFVALARLRDEPVPDDELM